MARYIFVDMSPRLLPVVLESQLIPGSFAHAVHYLVDVLDLSGFDAHDGNDDTGAPELMREFGFDASTSERAGNNGSDPPGENLTNYADVKRLFG